MLVRVAAPLCVLVAVTSSCGPSYEYLVERGEETEGALVEYDDRPLLITVATRLSRPAEVIAIVDVHVAHGEPDRALDELAREAADIGADAVVGVEFHHGESGGPHHLSGLAVRVLR